MVRHKVATVIVAELNKIYTDGKLEERLERYRNKHADHYTTQGGDTHADYVRRLINELVLARLPKQSSLHATLGATECAFQLARELGVGGL